ncbi:hypothetical protein RRG08_031435 [Elysia crispata]|uniref:Uncharacterized protein n=1 Tax=Elysia crispata TaxID=231223 RepID=A0AAE0ZNG5_9GAST|nr:hypothetical protein RRG08_031435 [Elysia crispata]
MATPYSNQPIPGLPPDYPWLLRTVTNLSLTTPGLPMATPYSNQPIPGLPPDYPWLIRTVTSLSLDYPRTTHGYSAQ